MPSIFSNPNVMQMAGLAVMSGSRVGDAIKEAVTQDALMQQQAYQSQLMQQQQAEIEREAAAREAMMNTEAPQGVDPELWKADPMTALKMTEFLTKAKQQQQQQRMMESIFGGGQTSGGTADPLSLAQAGVLSGNSDLLQLATFMQSQQDKARDAANKKAEVSVKGFDISEDVMPTADDAKKMKDVVTAKNELDKLLSGLYSDVEKYGTELYGSKSREMANKVAQIKGVAKNLEQLGALSGSDLELVEDMISDPTSMKAAVTDTDSIKKGMRGYGKYIADKIASNAESRGYKPIEPVKAFYENGIKTTGNAPAAAIQALKSNPALADQFKAKYGYLPEGL